MKEERGSVSLSWKCLQNMHFSWMITNYRLNKTSEEGLFVCSIPQLKKTTLFFLSYFDYFVQINQKNISLSSHHRFHFSPPLNGVWYPSHTEHNRFPVGWLKNLWMRHRKRHLEDLINFSTGWEFSHIIGGVLIENIAGKQFLGWYESMWRVLPVVIKPTSKSSSL